ncbi:MAG: MetQ/NlpA family ABC transporter substrate-binding protein [Coriobacteriia bacterium]|nr:MetQ/NlpA family ABC transporter substrate-binding protein [Coriobacteriia bacterium]
MTCPNASHQHGRKPLFFKLASTVLIILAVSMGLFLSACSGSDGSDKTSGNPSTGTAAVSPKTIKVGTMPTEDMLPYWVAAQDGVFAANGLDVQVITFQSAQELSTALTAKEIDMAMTDTMVSASLEAGGTPVDILWVTLGLTPEQGRFGILVNPSSGITSVDQLAGQPIALSSNTILEYVTDGILGAAGLSPDQIVTTEVKKVPVRYEMVAAGQVAAAALPASLLYMGEKNGLVVIADDTQGANLSQSVMIARSDFLDSTDAATMDALKTSWNQAVDLIAANPDSYRDLLAQNAQLPDSIAGDYPISDYPKAQLPSQDTIDAVLQWMDAKGYLQKPVSYNAQTGALSLD